jgi:hypothetical protein
MRMAPAFAASEHGEGIAWETEQPASLGLFLFL